MSDVKEKIREYWDLRGKDYDKSPGHASLPEVWRDVLASVFERRMQILDVGTGTGFLALILAELGHEVVGIDLSKGMLEVAKKKARKLGVDVEFKLGDAENLPFDDCSFDAVICRHLLWTLPNPQKAIEEWSRVVRDGGKVVAIDGKWLDSSPPAKLRRFIGRIAVAVYERRNPWKNYHYRKEINKMLPFYGGSDPEKVAEMFGRAGLSDISVKDLSWIREMMLNSQPFVYRLAWGGRNYFMIEGFKRV
ncbi:class I SAM-dependent methyltransferase [Archaeoglobus veneficus]|nr:methyltransferase domain-containing protein [Archaeoglobus veneficus]